MIDLINKIAEAGILLDIVDGELKLFSGKSDIDADLIAEIKSQKEKIRIYLLESGTLQLTKQQVSKIPVCPESENYPVSDGQRRLWVLNQFEQDSAAYNMVFSKTVEIKEVDIFKMAVNSVLLRHEILRTVFKEDENGELRQVILSPEMLGFEIGYRDFRLAQDGTKAVENYIAKDAYRPFDLEKGPLIRATLLQLADEKFVFYYNMHHIIGDGWSVNVLVRDVLAYYESFAQNKTVVLPVLDIQYKDYAVWQQNQLSSKAYETHQQYWTQQFAASTPVLDLSSDLRRPKLRTSNGKSINTYLSASLSKQLKDFCQQNGGSLFMGLLATLNALFFRYTAERTFVIGCPVAGRSHQDLENQIGFYINTLALKNEVKNTDNFNDLFFTVKQRTLEAYEHQQYPFDRLIEDLVLNRDTSRNPLFDVMLVLQNATESTTSTLQPEDALMELSYKQAASKVDLEFIFEEQGDQISLSLIYNTDIYEQQTVNGLILHFRQLLTALLNYPERNIEEIDFLSGSEKEVLLNEFNDTARDYKKEKTVIDLFHAQVLNNPEGTAVVFDGQKMSYKELDQLSNQFANCLEQDHHIQQGDLVGIKLDRSEWVIVAIFAVLKLGAAYVPVDPEYSSERETHILNDAKVKLLITSEKYQADVRYKLFLIDKSFDVHLYADTIAERKISTGQLVYVIYTSGSTGMPKGVMITHASLMNYLDWGNSFYLGNDLRNGDFGLYTTLSFDLTVTSFFLPLTTGNTLWVFKNNDVQELLKSYLASNISCIKLTPAHISLLKELDIESSSIELAIVGGDSLLQSHIDILRKLNPAIRIYNEYGPTEATVGCMIYEVQFEGGAISIGYPIANTEIYVLNAAHMLQPIGVAGELCIGGEGLAAGYLNRPDLNALKFVPHPFNAGERIYKTGDIARWLPDGNMVFLGRKDDQVKVRGYRIELGEIEASIKQHADLEEVIVLAHENESGEKELMAFFISSKKENISEIRALITKTLPHYMIPSALIQIERVPLTVNGKTDRKALIAMSSLATNDGKSYVAPDNEMESELIKIWEQVLNRNDIGIQDDFFALGGHSLKAIRLITIVHKKYGVKLNVKQIFLNATIKAQAELIMISCKESFDEIHPAAAAAHYPLSFEQRRIWVLSQLEGGSEAFNMPCSFLLNDALDPELFERAIRAVIERHEILRTVFKEDENGEVRQWILRPEEVSPTIQYVDFRNKSWDQIRVYLAEEARFSFDLVNGPLLRMNFLHTDGDKVILNYNMHHIISDGISMQILSNDVISYYNSSKDGQDARPAPLGFHYKDYAVWQKKELKDEKIINQTQFWKNIFKNGIPRVHFPFQKKRPAIYSYEGNSISFSLDKELKSGLTELCSKYKGSMYTTFLFLVKTLIYQYTNATQLMVGSSFSTRIHEGLEKQLGFYINNLPLVTRINPDDTLALFYQNLRDLVFSISEKSWYPLELLVDEIGYKYDAAYPGLFNVLVDYHERNGLSSENESFTSYRYNIPCQFDLSLECFDKADGLVCVFTYNHSLMDEIQMELFKERFLLLVEQLSTSVMDLEQLCLRDLDLDRAVTMLNPGKEKAIFSLEEGF